MKPSVPCRRFMACKRPQNVPWKSALRQNFRLLFSPLRFHLSLCGSLASCGRRGIWWRKLEMSNTSVGKKGCTISLKAALQPGHVLRALVTKKKKKGEGKWLASHDGEEP